MSQSNQSTTTAEIDEFYAPATSSGGSSAPAIAAGNYIGRCVQMVLMGTFDDEYMGKKKKTTKVRLTFELPLEMHVYKEENGEEPRLISKEYSFFMNDKANLRKDLESWRGQKFTDEEAAGFNISKLLGVPVMVNVIQKVSQKGNTYSVIASLTPIPKGFTVPAQITPSTTFSINSFNQAKFDALPEFLRKEIQQSDEYKKLFGNAPAQAQQQQQTYQPGMGMTSAPAAKAPATQAATAAPTIFSGGGDPDDLPF